MKSWESWYSDITRERLPCRLVITAGALRALGFEISANFTVTVGGRETPVEAIADLGLPFWIRAAAEEISP